MLVTSPQSADTLTTIADLKGHIAGVTTAGSSSQMLLTYILQRNGVAADAVSITAIGSAATAIAALEHGKVDVGMVADPAFTLVHRRNPGVRVLADLRTAAGVNAALGDARVSGVGALCEGRVDPRQPRDHGAARARHHPHAGVDADAHAAGDRR